MSVLKDKTAVVTGAGRGSGAAIAATLARSGARVVCTDIDGDAADATAAAIRRQGADALSAVVDHTVNGDCQRAVEVALSSSGSLDVLVNNAGAAVTGSALEVSEDDLLGQLRVNVLGPLLMTQAALPTMMEQRSGSIVMIASIAGITARPDQAPYVISKHGVIGLMRSLAVDYARHGIRVNAVCPEFIRTPMTEAYIEGQARRQSKRVDDTVAQLGEVFPLGRLGDPSDVAAATLHFASEESGWVTGQAYVLDGGLSLVRPQRVARPPS